MRPTPTQAIFASEDEAPAAGKALGEALTWLDSALDPTGPYAAGANFTLADAALTPFVIRVSLLQGLIGYKVPEGLDRVKAWQAVVLDRQSVKDSIVPPDPSKGWEEQLLESYRAYLASRRAA
jgi:glutathione S-transferase